MTLRKPPDASISSILSNTFTVNLFVKQCFASSIKIRKEPEVCENLQTVRQLLDGMLPTILSRYPYMSNAIDGIELLDLRIEKL